MNTQPGEEKKTLCLTEVKVYAVWASDNDKGTEATVRGYFEDFNIAKQRSKGIAFFGSDGRVELATVWTDGKSIYLVEDAGKVIDDRITKDELIATAKAKLTKEELAILGID